MSKFAENTRRRMEQALANGTLTGSHGKPPGSGGVVAVRRPTATAAATTMSPFMSRKPTRPARPTALRKTPLNPVGGSYSAGDAAPKASDRYGTVKAEAANHAPAAYGTMGSTTAPTPQELFNYVGAGTQALAHLQQQGLLGEDGVALWEQLQAAHDNGHPADARVTLTRLQQLLTGMTAADAAVAGDEQIQAFRRQIHNLLDHQGGH